MAQKSAYYYKELFVELGIRLANTGGRLFQVQTADTSIQDMISLFPKLGGNEFTHSALDQDAKAESRWEDLEVMDEAEMRKQVKSALLYPVTRAAVERLVDEELLAYGVDVKRLPEAVVATANLLHQKIGMVVKKRVGELNPKVAPPKREDSFRCYLHILIGGWANNAGKIVLYFTYTDSFAHFVTQLQDATRHCVIPPKNVQPPSQQSKPNYPDSQDPIFRNRGADETGYTLLDGPWLYRLAETKLGLRAKARYRPSKPIAWEEQYNTMKSEIRESAKELEKNPIKDQAAHVIISHSMDEMANTNLREQRDLDRQEEEAFQARFKQILIDNADNPWVVENDITDGGERYTDMMSRVHRENRAAWEVGGLEYALAASQQVSPGSGSPVTSLTQSLYAEMPIKGGEMLQRSSSGFGGSSTSPGDTPSDTTTTLGNTPA